MERDVQAPFGCRREAEAYGGPPSAGSSSTARNLRSMAKARNAIRRLFRIAEKVADLESAKRHLAEVYMPACNAEFAQPARESGSAFVPCRDLAALDDVLCEVRERTVGRDNCARFKALALQLPADRHRPHCAKVRVKVRRRVAPCRTERP